MKSGCFTVITGPNGAHESLLQRYRLRCPSGYNGGSLLDIWISDGDIATVDLPPALTRLLIVVALARKQDSKTGARNFDGWRPRSQISKSIDELYGYGISESTVTAYAARLVKIVREIVESTSNSRRLPLLQRRRGYGVRLDDGIRLDVIDGTAPNDNSRPYPVLQQQSHP